MRNRSAKLESHALYSDKSLLRSVGVSRGHGEGQVASLRKASGSGRGLSLAEHPWGLVWSGPSRSAVKRVQRWPEDQRPARGGGWAGTEGPVLLLWVQRCVPGSHCHLVLWEQGKHREGSCGVADAASLSVQEGTEYLWHSGVAGSKLRCLCAATVSLASWHLTMSEWCIVQPCWVTSAPGSPCSGCVVPGAVSVQVGSPVVVGALAPLAHLDHVITSVEGAQRP